MAGREVTWRRFDGRVRRGRADPTGRGRSPGTVGPVGNVRPLGGQAWLVEAGGRRLVAKLGPGVLDESDGLRQLAAVPGAPPVPEVVHAEDGLLVTTAIEQMARGPGHDESLGRSLAVLHSAPLPTMGRGLVVDRCLPGRSIAKR